MSIKVYNAGPSGIPARPSHDISRRITEARGLNCFSCYLHRWYITVRSKIVNITCPSTFFPMAHRIALLKKREKRLEKSSGGGAGVYDHMFDELHSAAISPSTSHFPYRTALLGRYEVPAADNHQQHAHLWHKSLRAPIVTSYKVVQRTIRELRHSCIHADPCCRIHPHYKSLVLPPASPLCCFPAVYLIPHCSPVLTVDPC